MGLAFRLRVGAREDRVGVIVARYTCVRAGHITGMKTGLVAGAANPVESITRGMSPRVAAVRLRRTAASGIRMVVGANPLVYRDLRSGLVATGRDVAGTFTDPYRGKERLIFSLAKAIGDVAAAAAADNVKSKACG